MFDSRSQGIVRIASVEGVWLVMEDESEPRNARSRETANASPTETPSRCVSSSVLETGECRSEAQYKVINAPKPLISRACLRAENP